MAAAASELAGTMKPALAFSLGAHGGFAAEPAFTVPAVAIPIVATVFAGLFV